jgi:hypothetical protein
MLAGDVVSTVIEAALIWASANSTLPSSLLITNMKGSVAVCAMISISNAWGSGTISLLTRLSFSAGQTSASAFRRSRRVTRCGDRRGSQRERLVLVEQPDAQPRLATVLGQQCLQAEIAFLEHGTAM